MTSKKTRMRVRELSNFTTDPSRAGEAMLEAVKGCVKSTRRLLAVKLLKGLRKRRIGTYAIEKTAKIVTENLVRSENVVLKMMDIAVTSAEEKCAMAEKLSNKSLIAAKAVLPEGWMKKKFKLILSDELEALWKETKTKHAKKKDILERKLKPRKEEAFYMGIPIGDEELGEDTDADVRVLAYGVEVTRYEEEFLKLPKSATDYVKIDEESFKTNIQVMAAKLRMGVKENEDVGSQGMDDEAQDQILESRRVYDGELGEVDFRKKRVTDMETCKRIKPPDATEAAKEAKIQVLIDNLEDVVMKNAREEAYQKDGRPRVSTLSEQARKGRASLMAREKAGELVVVGTDKSGKLAVMDRELYKQCMEPHIQGDTIHTREEVEKVENQFNGAATQLLRAFKFGDDWGHTA